MIGVVRPVERTRTTSMLELIAAVLFALSLPLLLVTTNVNALLFDARFYEQGEIKYALGKTTSLTLDEMRAINRGIISYFRFETETLPAAFKAAGADEGVFNERELAHMADVRQLVRLAVQVQQITGVYAAVFLIGGLALGGAAFLPRAAGALAWGSGLTLALVALLGVFAATDFSTFFVQFHLISFSNDLWILDPRTDRLIQMFPEPFWYEASLTIVLRTVAAALALGLLGGGYLIWAGRRPA